MVLGPIDGLWELFFFRPGFRNLPKKPPPKSLRLTSFFHVFGTIGVETGPIGQPTAAKFELEVAASVPGGLGPISAPRGKRTSRA